MLRSLGQHNVGRREFGKYVKGDLGARLGNGGEVVIVILLVIDGKAGAELFTCRTVRGLDSVRNNGEGDHNVLVSVRRAAGVGCEDFLGKNVQIGGEKPLSNLVRRLATE